MTAEIAVYNKSAVALAADSAVTIASGENNKIYNGAEKLLALTKHHPVGIMVYGSGDLCSAPWELVIKAYRKQLGSIHFETLEGYADDFFKFLETSVSIVTAGMRAEHLYQYLSDSVFTSLINTFTTSKSDSYWSPLNIDLFFDELQDFCLEILEILSNTEFLDGFSGDDMDATRDYSKQVTNLIVSEKFNLEPSVSIPESLINVLCDVFAAMVCKKSDTGNITGIVIAGYGEDDYYPKVLSYEVCGFFNNKIRKSTNEGKCSKNGDCGVTPFAQEEEVSAFMQGVGSNLISELHQEYEGSIENLLDGIDEVITEMIPNDKLDDAKKAIVEVVNNTVAECTTRIQSFVHQNYVKKVVDMIKFLPKQDLAYMAESLVNLTAFKRKVSDDSETVGGPIDVAIISKADGFIWVKRKHYFSKDLNYHYFDKS